MKKFVITEQEKEDIKNLYHFSEKKPPRHADYGMEPLDVDRASEDDEYLEDWLEKLEQWSKTEQGKEFLDKNEKHLYDRYTSSTEDKTPFRSVYSY